MAIRKLKSLLLISLIIVGCYPHHVEEPQIRSSKNCLWRIQSEQNTVYLMGSLHLLKKENYPLHKEIEKAFEDSKVLVLEVDLGEANDPRTQQMMLMKGMFTDGRTLEKAIDEKTYDLAKMKLGELGVDIAPFNNFKPWFFATTLVTIKMQALGFNPELGLDAYFFKKAKQSGKKVIGLETFEYQLGLLDKMSASNQELMVEQSLLELDLIEKEMGSLVQAWSSGDTKGLEDTLLLSFKDFPELYNSLIISRNKKWLEDIESFLRERDHYMIIVGAGHLIGEKGLVELLKKKGYSVEQL
jgi:uncharacterized protein YbaP (TraB family)